jgi:protein SCO1/2
MKPDASGSDVRSLGAGCLAAALAIAIAATGHAELPPALREVGIDQRLDEQVPLDLVFRDEHGTPGPLRRHFRGKPVILSLVYYECPMLCTLVLNGLVSALGVLSFDVGREFEVVTVSFDPAETPALAAAKKDSYLQRYRRAGASEGWHFLTGDAVAIAQLARSVGFRYTYDSERKQFAHAAGIVLLTPEGRIARYFFGVEYAPRDLRLGLVEATQNRIGTVVDQLLLFCFHYDPSSGRYSAATMNLIRAGSAITALLLAGFVITMLRREHAALGKARG